MKSKEQAIKEAYGDHWETVKEYVDDKGWCVGYWGIFEQLDGISKPRSEGTKWRPKSLQGLENNNGWIKIESEEDLPKENIDCHYIFEVPSHYHNAGTKILTGRYNFEKNIMSQQKNYFTIDNFFFHRPPFVTHYKPIEQPQPPIY